MNIPLWLPTKMRCGSNGCYSLVYVIVKYLAMGSEDEGVYVD